MYLERYLPDPRHVEVQVLADGHGSVIHLGERDCSIQRRHQKLIEESPAPLVDEALRERIGKIATEAARAVDYRGAGTIEGLLQDGEYYFLEMNTRVQVEHCVTEATTGIDIVREQIRIAAGEPLSVAQDEVVLRGHAIECRINAEDAAKNFAPAPGLVTRYREPSGPGVRVDSGVLAGSEITPLYDPMVAKLIVWDVDRETRDAADGAGAGGVRDRRRPDADPVPQGDHGVGAVGRGGDLPGPGRGPGVAEDAGVRAARRTAAATDEGRGRRALVHRRGVREAVRRDGARRRDRRAGRRRLGAGRAASPRRERKRRAAAAAGGDTLASPLQGNVFKVLVEQGATVEEGALVCIIEAMKMENEITAHKAGVVAELPIAEGAAVTVGATLAVIKSPLLGGESHRACT